MGYFSCWGSILFVSRTWRLLDFLTLSWPLNPLGWYPRVWNARFSYVGQLKMYWHSWGVHSFLLFRIMKKDTSYEFLLENIRVHMVKFSDLGDTWVVCPVQSNLYFPEEGLCLLRTISFSSPRTVPVYASCPCVITTAPPVTLKTFWFKWYVI